MGMPEEGENKNDKWIIVTGNGKGKILLNPKPTPKLHNAFAILSNQMPPPTTVHPAPYSKWTTTEP